MGPWVHGAMGPWGHGRQHTMTTPIEPTSSKHYDAIVVKKGNV